MLFNSYRVLTCFDLINKFYYENHDLPKIKLVTLYFTFKKSNFKSVIISLLFLELISYVKGKLVSRKVGHVKFKLRKGSFVACKVVLIGKSIFSFLEREHSITFEKHKRTAKGKLVKNNIIYKIYNLFRFFELSQKYFLISNFKALNVKIFTNTTKTKELAFLFNSLKLPRSVVI